MKTKKLITKHILFICLAITPLSMHAFSHIQGLLFGSLFGAGIGYYTYFQEKKAHQSYPELNKTPNKWYSYVLKGATIGTVCGLGLTELKRLGNSLQEKIDIDMARKNSFLDIDLTRDDIEVLKSINFDIKKVQGKKISGFDIFNLDPIHTSPEIAKKAFRELGLKYHPDKAKNEAERNRNNHLMALLNGAHQSIINYLTKQNGTPTNPTDETEQPQNVPPAKPQSNKQPAPAGNTTLNGQFEMSGKHGQITILDVD